MISLLNCNQLLYAHLSQGKLSQELKGGIYTADTRPLDDAQEALVIQTIALRYGTPQSAKGSLSLYVPDLYAVRQGKRHRVANLLRLNQLSALLLEEVHSLQMQGIYITLEGEHLFELPAQTQHALSYEIHWHIML